METIGSYEAKTHLPQLLVRVEHGEAFTITRHGRAVARLVPATPRTARPDTAEVIAAMARFQEREAPTLGHKASIRDLVNEGRR
jgi:prevent-host-death family protein